MNDLYTYILNLENSLDNEEIIKKLKRAYKVVKNNKELVNDVLKYNNTQDEELRMNLRQDPDIQRVKELEVELNYLILEINKNLSILTNKRSL